MFFGGYFRAKTGAYTHGCEQGNNHNASAIRPTDRPWWGEGGDHGSALLRMARSVQVFALPPIRKSMAVLANPKRKGTFLFGSGEGGVQNGDDTRASFPGGTALGADRPNKAEMRCAG